MASSTNPREKGGFVTYNDVETTPDTSFLETLDILNETLIEKGEEPIVFDHDCREGICGMCSLYINGHPHGPKQQVRLPASSTCVVSRTARLSLLSLGVRLRSLLSRTLWWTVTHSTKIQQAGGYVSFNCGGAQDANDLPISKVNADEAMDSASCIGCGACVAACKNGSAMLFVSAKISQIALLPQGAVEKDRRVRAMVAKMDELGFGNCTNTYALLC